MPANPLSGQTQPFTRGDPAPGARDFNRLGDALFGLTGVFPSPFGYGGRFPGGDLFVPLQQKGGGGGTAVTLYPPWWPYLAGTSGSQTANFYPGTIGGILPSNMMSPLSLDQTHTNYVYAEMTATSGNLTGATLAASTTFPTIANATSGSPPTAFNIPIAIFAPASSLAESLVGFGNIWVQPFVVLFDTINTGALLTAPFTPWYNWEWGASA